MGVHDYICHVERNGQCLMGAQLLDRPMTTEEELAEGEEGIDLSDRDTFMEHLEFIYDESCTCDAGEGRLVLLPRDMTREQVQSLSLAQLADYPTRLEKYSWDRWDFPDYPGYSSFLMGCEEDQSIWYNDDHWIVNFHPTTYNVFVKGTYPAEQISIGWYLQVLNDRGTEWRDLTSFDKGELYQMVISGHDKGAASSS